MAVSTGAPSSHGGIPAMPFIEDIDTFMEKEGKSAESALQKLHEQYNGYKYMEQRLIMRKMKLKVKIPDIEKTLGVVTRMKQSQEEGDSSLRTHYELSDAVYAAAQVPIVEDQKVFLWLGANVMLEYPLDEAIELLQTNLSNAQKTLEEVKGDIGFLKDQMTTSEVNIARVFNWDVRERKKQKEGAEGK
mmetsp:Transcript_6829/g.20208  ORF Transcript_6829/g.20208 Transcript_6829/m.20208 type:complete len:189 (-) Transcript_6829:165-731(-)|eukprot:CAMPEP_0206032678 /NCGR_PEP_ID=MMETSP1466-20131121/112_1 /ASSEMBLY_ACC=CAM_ASM_001126 /TAXON_ID=44452 /ORGANISM="Pavlova gyrans, Strain CCMP608" /LENGTH=188 /DNA_ID=CAMNT_0053406813 /DNA_START=29 /DNA_END=595 /DNA_ORIENTATION=-